MKLDGRELAEKIYVHLKTRVRELQKKNVTPQLAVILVGKNPASLAYVIAKQKQGEKIGATINIIQYPESVTSNVLIKKVTELNADSTVHGILIQRPLPDHIDSTQLEMLTNPEKDIDGFHPQSPYTLPLPLAVIEILGDIFLSKQPEKERGIRNPIQLLNWLSKNKIVILGKGETGGKPIIAYFQRLGLMPQIVDSKTPNRQKILKQADILISAVGKEQVITPAMIKKEAILIGVGMHKDPNGKLRGDYDEEAIKEKASFYTPTPGGVGPVNVAMLMDNLLTATEKQTA